MPPVNKAGNTQFRKDVEFVTKNEDEQVAAGIVMVPDKVDLQNDFVREETLREFADQFEAFVDAGEAGGGIMHAVFPDGWMELKRNEVLDEAEEIGGQTVDAGAWVQEWAIENADLWELIDDGILAGYSIGAIQVGWNGPFEQDADEVGDVDTSEIPDDELVWELIAGLIREVSAVDIPAVPDAQILEAKAFEKRLGDYLGDPDGFVEEALQRGHTEAEAERLWDVLNAAVQAEGSSEPGKESMLTRAAKAFLSALSANEDADAPAATVSETPETDPRKSQTPDNVSDPDGSDDKDAPGGDTPDTNDTTDMSDNDPDDEDFKELVEQQQEQIKELNSAVQTLTEAIAGPQPKTAEIEIDGETYEVPEDAAKAALGVDEDAGVGVEDAIKALEEKAGRVDEVEQRLDQINQQSGVSTQLESNAETEESEESGLEGLGKALS